MNILIIHEIDWLKKVIYEPHHLAELFSMKGHKVFAIDCRVVSQASKYEYEKDISRSENLSFYDISFSKFYGSGLLIKTFIDKIFSLLALTIPKFFREFLDHVQLFSKN